MTTYYVGAMYNEFNFLPKTVDEDVRQMAKKLLEKEAEQAQYIQDMREAAQRGEERLKEIRKQCADFASDLDPDARDKAESDLNAYCG